MSSQADPLQTTDEQEGQTVNLHGQTPAADMPSRVGRYRVERLLGAGSFGRVYLAHDDELHRPVAIKVPHRQRVAQPEDIAAYLAEARVLASLDHVNIVPVYDLGRTDDNLCFVVSKFIEGNDLKRTLQVGRPSFHQSASLVATIADALHYAHRKGLVHRDIKPGNILLDSSGKPYVADFGLALREEDFGKGAKSAGTPAYMSPEQARGEGHRVDGRSDIFSLGVVFYELLTGQKPFRAETLAELLEQIGVVEPRPPRQVDDAIPRELERICLKTLAKRVSERYTTATDLADDLRHFLTRQSATPSSVSGHNQPHSLPAPGDKPSLHASHASTLVSGTSASPGSSSASQLVQVVPKGLRSFDAHDADFFLELLPGPRDREGLPESIRFWKNRIEKPEADQPFPVGLIYGPSGCGKSSLVKAGLLPRLKEQILAVYVEATDAETESRLLKGLRKACPDLPHDGGLVQALASLRKGQVLSPGQKVLLVLDQFEQWLHAAKEQETTELVQALRQCDGRRVQCLLLVRDDFWLAASRFMRDLEVELVQGRNLALVDLFDLRHARKVLGAFGRALGALPASDRELTREQAAFLDQAVSGLAQNGKVISVRLALFAEMVKGKPWTPTTLRTVGGMEGVGAAFLEENFVATTAPPQYRLQQRAAQAVLRALLPASGTDIRGTMQSRARLLAASGYAEHPRDFDTLLRILESELRLITPTDPEGLDEGNPPQPSSGGRFYQLTHDYLVPSLRDWLTRKQRETRRGRAELLLAEQAPLWQSKRERRHLPALWEWVRIRLFTQKRNWTLPQRQMMQAAGRYYALSIAVFALALVLLALGGMEYRGRMKAQALRDQLLGARTTEVPGIVASMAPYRRWVDPLLREAYAQARTQEDARRQLHLSLALLPTDPGEADYLYERLLSASAHEVPIIRTALLPTQERFLDPLWKELGNQQGDPERRFCAACALAAYAPDDSRWQQFSADVAARLVAENSLVQREWIDTLRGVGPHLLPSLAHFLEESREVAQRRLIVNVYQAFAEGQEDAFALLEQKLSEPSLRSTPVEARVAHAQRQANIGAALVAMGRGTKVWPLLRHSPDPTLRSYLIERLGSGEASPRLLDAQLEQERNPSIRRALLLALGTMGHESLPPGEQARLTSRFTRLYAEDPDPGIHAAAEWLLRQWQQHDKLRNAGRQLAMRHLDASRDWYVNRENQTLTIIRGPVETWLGEGERRHRQRIDHSFALAAREVTLAEFARFRKDHHSEASIAYRPDCPVNSVSWYEAAEYCNWLSERDGIPRDQWCYLPNDSGKFDEGMRVPRDYLRRTGYRLPTEAEWQFAASAGAETAWPCGEGDQELLAHYAWFFPRSSINATERSCPVGTLKPNDLGLFDMLGNVSEWCQDPLETPAPGTQTGLADDTDVIRIMKFPSRTVRGGYFAQRARSLSSTARIGLNTLRHDTFLGFRPARTLR